MHPIHLGQCIALFAVAEGCCRSISGDLSCSSSLKKMFVKRGPLRDLIVPFILKLA